MYSQETRIYHALLIGAIIFAMAIMGLITTIIRYQRKKARLYHDTIQVELTTLEKERARIAKDLHDDIGMTISTISMLLAKLESSSKNDLFFIQKMKKHIDGMMGKIKSLSYNLMPKILEVGGIGAAVADLLDILGYSGHKIQIECDCNIPVNIMDKNREMQVYRIIEEIINNTLKHAEATSIFCQLKQVDDKLCVIFNDNGKGFDKKQVMKNPRTSGLQNIIARVNMLKGSIYLDTGKSKGVHYLIEIPI